MKKKVALHNLGCKVNAYEVEAMQQLLENAGYETVPFEEGADVYVINTCTVTNIADRKSRQMLHKAKKMNPEAIVVATGCYAQADTEKLKEDTAVDLILGNNQKTQIVEALEEYEKEHAKQVQVIEINHTKEYEELSISSTAEHVRAYIKVQDGCNQFCTYCIIPFARGRVRSRKIEEVLSEVETLAAKGYKEVVLTGIHLSSYGVDFPKEERESLLSLIQAVSRVEGISRIRLGSLEPRIITEEFLEGIVKTGKVCPHFHLSLQSGCNKTLKNMNRRYSAQEYAEKFLISHLMKKNPYELSGGEKQRVAICRALINDPDLVLADEPTGNLDSKSGKIVIDALTQINREFKKTIVMVTHDPQMASYCSRIILLKDGLILDTLKRGESQEAFYQEIIGRMAEL